MQCKDIGLNRDMEKAINDLIRASLGSHGKVDWNLH
jgi:hypothetical protein